MLGITCIQSQRSGVQIAGFIKTGDLSVSVIQIPIVAFVGGFHHVLAQRCDLREAGQGAGILGDGGGVRYGGDHSIAVHAGGIGIEGVVGAQHLCLIVHRIDEILHRSGNRNGQNLGSVVGAVQKQSVQHVLCGDHLAHLQSHIVAHHLVQHLGRNGDGTIRILTQGFYRQNAGHQLDGGGGIDPLVGIQFIQNGVVFEIIQIRPGSLLDFGWFGGKGGGDHTGQKKQSRQDASCKGEQSFFHKGVLS